VASALGLVFSSRSPTAVGHAWLSSASLERSPYGRGCQAVPARLWWSGRGGAAPFTPCCRAL
jgi:hypothetical protein